ncbi:hypothetical protein T35B1_16473 [Salinisphaera shabanensis T35B1]|uniref:hypothetical protein n=1 Tax=Salinisphaera shabanensis TaxID=180542 RepID=UPI0033420FB2
MADKESGRNALSREGVHRNESVVFIQLTKGREAIIDRDVWPRIRDQFGKRWMCIGDGQGRYYATKNTHDENGIRRHITLPRAVMDAEPGERVETLNGNALDCRRSNLHKLTTVAAAKRRKQYAAKKAAREKARYDAARERHDRKMGCAERRRQSRRDWYLPADRLAQRFKASSNDHSGGA